MLLWLTAALAIPLSSQAVEVSGLYGAETAVTGQGRAERRSTARQLLQEVVLKVSGDPSVASAKQLKPLYKKASRLIQQYRYDPLPENDPLLTNSDSAPSPFTHLLHIDFDAAAIDAAILAAGFHIWGQQRPETLVWLAVDEGQSRHLVTNADSPWRLTLEAYAKKRGMPLIFPLLDLKDQSRASFATIWGSFRQDIFSASLRYNATATLVGRLHRTPSGLWQARWTLYQGHAEQDIAWSRTDRSWQALLGAGVDNTANILASRYAQVLDSEDHQLTLSVSEVTSIDDYARVLRYLSQLGSVAQTQINYVDSSHVVFNLTTRSNPIGLKRVISLGRTLAPPLSAYTDDMEPSADIKADLRYRLLP